MRRVSDNVFRKRGAATRRSSMASGAAATLPALAVVNKDIGKEPPPPMVMTSATLAPTVNQTVPVGTIAIASSHLSVAPPDQDLPLTTLTLAASVTAVTAPDFSIEVATNSTTLAFADANVDADADVSVPVMVAGSMALSFPTMSAPDQTVPIPAMSAALAILTVESGVTVAITADAATLSMLGPARVDQTVPVTVASIEAAILTAAVIGGGGPYAQMHTLVRQRVEEIVQTSRALSVAFPNEAEPPMLGSIACLADIDSTQTERLGGSRSAGFLYRKHGEVRLRLLSDAGLGTATLLDHVDAIRPEFRHRRVGTVRYGIPYDQSVGREGARWRHDVVMPFWSDDHHVPQANVGTQINPSRRQARDAAVSRFESKVTAPQSIVARHDNDPRPLPPDSRYVQTHIMQTPSIRVGQGVNSQVRTRGLLVAMIFEPLGTGTAESLRLADEIALGFRSVTDNGVHFETPSVVSVGRVEEKYQTNVQLPFRLEEVT